MIQRTEKDMPKISIVVPVYGVEKYIDQFLDSIRKQTFQNFEAVFVDDGSKDNCPLILDSFAKEDSRYKVIHQENGGISRARNTGLEHCCGEYVYIVDSDDWLEPTALEALWKEAERTGADVIYGDYCIESGTGTTRRRCFPKPFVSDDRETIRALQFGVYTNGFPLRLSRPEFGEIQHLGGAPWRALFKASVLRENQIRFDPYVRGLGDDILFTLHVYEYIQKVAYISEIIYHYREIEVSYSHGFKPDYCEAVSRIFEKHEEFLRDYHKDEFIRGAFYLLVMLYVRQGIKRYYKNTQNPKSEWERFDEFKQLVKTEPYHTAIRKAPLHFIKSRRLRMEWSLLRYRLYRLFWNREQ